MWWQELIIVALSSGVVGTIITAISKKKARMQTESIQEVVKETTREMLGDISQLRENQTAMTGILQDITTDLKSARNAQDDMKKISKKTQQEILKIKKESERVDFLLLKKLREKHILNGESDEIFEYLLEQKNEVASGDKKE